MKTLAKNLGISVVFGAAMLMAAVVANDEVKDIKHRVIEIKADTDKDVKIVVNSEGVQETIVFQMDELQDEDVIASKLAHLDDDTKETVMTAVNGIKHFGSSDFDPASLAHGEHKSKVVIMHKGDGELMHIEGDKDVEVDYEFVTNSDHQVMQKHVVIGGHHGSLKGHSSAIVSLIEKGEFSQEELDKIQAAIDKKR